MVRMKVRVRVRVRVRVTVSRASLTESDCEPTSPPGTPASPSPSAAGGPCTTRMLEGLRSQCTTPCECR